MRISGERRFIRSSASGSSVEPMSHYEPLLDRAARHGAMRAAVVHPCDALALESALAAKAAGLILPILVGNAAIVSQLARARRLDLQGCEIVDAADSRDAAALAVALARDGEVAAIVKGSLHSDELLRAILAPDSGLHTLRRLSHAYVIDFPKHPEPLLITDAVVNITPSLDEKRDVVQNAVDLAHTLGIAEVRVALLSAIESVNASVSSTIDAAALAKMAERGQITGAILDGPLALDDAVDAAAAAEKGIVSPVAGRANVLVVPDFESGNMLAKALIHFAGAHAAGVVLGARIPVALTSRADSIPTHVASIAIARLLVAEKAQVSLRAVPPPRATRRA
ncbi:MAG TPA: bifunctional enoyl-CoA hydratase/phosphate acetyltransferase [Candidatus Nitrosotalea sp.]|nr:bifunctional enoyl-CoA hydratase/phosphate acetyltransferase [Candidatus Nitrosotalea sp.]